MRFSSLTGIGLPRDQPFKNTEALPWRLGGTFQESISFTGKSFITGSGEIRGHRTTRQGGGVLSIDSKVPHLRCMESLQPHQAAKATAGWLLRAVEQRSLPLAARAGSRRCECWSSQPHSRKATDMFLSRLLMQIMVMENSFIWLKINLSS